MTRAEMMKELDRIIDVGIVNAHHDTDVLKAIREQLQETDFQAVCRILKGCKSWKGNWDVNDAETDSGKQVKDITLREYSDEVVLCFDENGRLYA